MRLSARWIAILLTGAVLWEPRAAQDAKKKPEVCPWCKNDPKRLEASKSISHGPLLFGKNSSDEIVKRLPAPQWLFLETPHMKFASSLGAENVTLAERPRVEADLEKLRKAFPNIPKKITQVDPWLRIHLMAYRAEEYYSKFEDVLKVHDEDFPASRQATGKYMGDGRFLGERNKFELVVHSDRKTHLLYTEEHMGVRITDALRWHFKDPHRMVASIAATDDLSSDKFLFPHVIHVATHLWFCAYKHFSYDPPAWLDEGLAHYLELDTFKDLNVTFCSDEGAGPERERSKNYLPEAKSLVDRKKATSFAELLHKKNFSDLKKEDHITAYAKVRFLAEEHPQKFAEFLGAIKGQLDEQGYPSGKDLPGLQRKLLKDLWNWTPDQFDQAFEVWIEKAIRQLEKLGNK